MESNPESWRVVVFTVLPVFPPMIESLLRPRGHRLVGILTAPGPRSRRTDGYRGVAQLARPGLDVIVSNYPDRWAAMIAPLRPDLIVTGGFNWIVPAAVLALPPLGAINVHDALLPKYRGMNATGWALRNNDPYGFTVHYMTPRLDDGPILAQRAVPYTDEDDGEAVLGRFVATIPVVMGEAFDRIAAGDPGIPQREEEVTHSPGRFEEAWGRIDWARPAVAIHRQVRSLWDRDLPLGAVGAVEGAAIRVMKTALVAGEGPATAAPGTVLDREGETLLIQCGDRPLRILRYLDESPSTSDRDTAALPQ